MTVQLANRCPDSFHSTAEAGFSWPEPYSEMEDDKLPRTLHGAREEAPPLGHRSTFEEKKGLQAIPVPALAMPLETSSKSQHQSSVILDQKQLGRDNSVPPESTLENNSYEIHHHISIDIQILFVVTALIIELLVFSVSTDKLWRRATWAVAILHGLISNSEMLYWETLMVKLRIFDAATSKITAPFGRYVGLYKGLDSICLILLLNAETNFYNQRYLGTVLLLCITIAGCFAGLTIRWPLLVLKAFPSLFALILLWSASS